MAKDLPLILMNMSGMNGNLVSQSDSPGQKMKLLFYGLGTLPIELLFSESVRLGCCEVDSWIPRDIVPGAFVGDHVLRLGAEGFTFHQQRGNKPVKFFLVSRSAVWQDQVLLSVTGRTEEAERHYVVRAAVPSTAQPPANSKNGWCILFETKSSDPRAARFMISRRKGNKVFLHFDCPLRLCRIHGDTSRATTQLPSYTCIARPADSQEEFIIEKSSTSQTLSMARPQNPTQYSDRLDFITQALHFGFGYTEWRIMGWLLGDTMNKNWLILIAYGVFHFMQRGWIEQALHAFVHRAWSETYSTTWSPNGSWKWFWKLSNYEPPIPFMAMTKYLYRFTFTISLLADFYGGVFIVSLYWYVCSETREMADMYVTGLLFKAVFWFFFQRS
jgi:hypothetical protein